MTKPISDEKLAQLDESMRGLFPMELTYLEGRDYLALRERLRLAEADLELSDGFGHRQTLALNTLEARIALADAVVDIAEDNAQYSPGATAFAEEASSRRNRGVLAAIAAYRAAKETT